MRAALALALWELGKLGEAETQWGCEQRLTAANSDMHDVCGVCAAVSVHDGGDPDSMCSDWNVGAALTRCDRGFRRVDDIRYKDANWCGGHLYSPLTLLHSCTYASRP